MSKAHVSQEQESRNRVDLKHCKAIMNRNGLEYTDEEILQIRDFLYKMAEMTILHYERVKDEENRIINLEKNNDNEQAESIPLYSDKYKRAS